MPAPQQLLNWVWKMRVSHRSQGGSQAVPKLAASQSLQTGVNMCLCPAPRTRAVATNMLGQTVVEHQQGCRGLAVGNVAGGKQLVSSHGNSLALLIPDAHSVKCSKLLAHASSRRFIDSFKKLQKSSTIPCHCAEAFTSRLDTSWKSCSSADGPITYGQEREKSISIGSACRRPAVVCMLPGVLFREGVPVLLNALM